MMAQFSFPTSPDGLEQWCRERIVKFHEGRQRLMEYVVLDCIASSRLLADGLVFKGGNALRFVYDSPRSTTDLDFTADTVTKPLSDDPEALRNAMDSALRRAASRFGVKAKCQRIRRNPKRRDATRPTFAVRVGYQFPTDRYYHSFAEHNVSTGVNLEISLFDLVCEADRHRLVEDLRGRIRVCTLEDILAEKLRALLQQPICNRHRQQDVYDIARFTTPPARSIDRSKIADFLIRKAAVRDIEVRRAAFDEQVRSMAEFEYDIRMRQQGGDYFIPFDDAWEAVLALVNSLDLPD